jgi:hypothetical protein
MHPFILGVLKYSKSKSIYFLLLRGQKSIFYLPKDIGVGIRKVESLHN